MTWSVLNNIDALQELGAAPSILEEATQWNIKWKASLASPMGPYLAYGDPQVLWKRPDGPLVSLESIAQRVSGSPPDSILFNFGFLPVWASGGGNVIAFHPETQAFYWAHHEQFFPEKVMVPKTYELLPLNHENLMRALTRLSDEDCGTYLRGLRDGRYEAELAKLE